MKKELLMKIFCVVLLFLVANTATAQTVTKYDGEYATDQTEFEFEITDSVDDSGSLKYYWGFNNTGDGIRFKIGESVFSEDYVDVYYDFVWKIPMEIFINDVELDVNTNGTIFDYWESTFWERMVLPIEDGKYNNFDVLEEQDPAAWDVKTDEVSLFTPTAEWVYDYNTGVLLTWTSTVSYEFTLVNKSPPQESTTTVTSEDSGNFLDGIPFSTPAMIVGIMALASVKLIQTKRFKKN